MIASAALRDREERGIETGPAPPRRVTTPASRDGSHLVWEISPQLALHALHQSGAALDTVCRFRTNWRERSSQYLAVPALDKPLLSDRYFAPTDGGAAPRHAAFVSSAKASGPAPAKLAPKTRVFDKPLLTCNSCCKEFKLRLTRRTRNGDRALQKLAATDGMNDGTALSKESTAIPGQQLQPQNPARRSGTPGTKEP